MVVTPFVVQFVMRGGEWKSRCGVGRERGEEVYCIVWLFEKKNNYKTREEDLIPTMVFFAEDEFVLLHGFHQDRMDHCVTRARISFNSGAAENTYLTLAFTTLGFLTIDHDSTQVPRIGQCKQNPRNEGIHSLLGCAGNQ